VGQSYLDTRTIEDTLDLSMGRDKKIIVTRVKKKDFSSKKFLGSNKKTTLTYEISVKNTRTQMVEIEIQDQIPVSKQSDIQVDVQEISGAQLIENTGKLIWKLQLAPGEVRKMTLSFSVKHPKNKSIELKKSRVISAPRF
jgi:uncharacterized protein (TIGR02231 family)